MAVGILLSGRHMSVICFWGLLPLWRDPADANPAVGRSGHRSAYILGLLYGCSAGRSDMYLREAKPKPALPAMGSYKALPKYALTYAASLSLASKA